MFKKFLILELRSCCAIFRLFENLFSKARIFELFQLQVYNPKIVLKLNGEHEWYVMSIGIKTVLNIDR